MPRRRPDLRDHLEGQAFANLLLLRLNLDTVNNAGLLTPQADIVESARHVSSWQTKRPPVDAVRLSAPSSSIDRAATVRGCSCPHSHTRGTDPRRHGSCNRTRHQPNAWSRDATGRIANVLAVDHRTGLFSARGYEPAYQQRGECECNLHSGLPFFGTSKGPIGLCSTGVRARQPVNLTAQLPSDDPAAILA